MAAALRRPAALGLGLALIVAMLDQLSKLWLIGWLAARGPIEVLPVLNLVMVWNRGVSFGLFGAAELGPWPFVALSGAIVVGLLVWLARVGQRWLGLAIGAVVGGAVGNVVDRIRFGAVADFLDFHVAGYHWPAFNLADAAIVLGVAAIVLEALLQRRGHETERKPQP